MCSYCGCDSIEVIGRFMNEHVEIINATGDLRRAVEGGDAAELDAKRQAVAALLWPHTQAEEVGLFAVMAREDEFAGHIETLCGEHKTLDQFLVEVVTGDHASMARFEDALREHIHKEDNGLFPAAAIALSGDAWLEVHSITPHAHDHDHDHTHDHAHPHEHGAH